MNTTSGVLACLLAILLGVFCLFYGPGILLLISTKSDYRNSPEMWMVPQPLAPVSSTLPAGRKLSYFGYQFESPAADTKETKKAEGAVVIDFSGCADMAILKPNPSGNLISAMRANTKNGAPEAVQLTQDLFGEGASRSDYALRSATLNSTPHDLRLFASPRKIAGEAVLLRLKAIEASRFKNGLHSFETPWMRGFEEGDLQRDKAVVIQAFDNQDRLLTITVGARPGKSCFSQQELDHILFSLRPVPAN